MAGVLFLLIALWWWRRARGRTDPEAPPESADTATLLADRGVLVAIPAAAFAAALAWALGGSPTVFWALSLGVAIVACGAVIRADARGDAAAALAPAGRAGGAPALAALCVLCAVTTLESNMTVTLAARRPSTSATDNATSTVPPTSPVICGKETSTPSTTY